MDRQSEKRNFKKYKTTKGNHRHNKIEETAISGPYNKRIEI